MPVSVRLKPEVEQLLKQACKRERKTRSALIHDALASYLRPRKARLGDVIREALAQAPQGFRIERRQPRTADKRDW